MKSIDNWWRIEIAFCFMFIITQLLFLLLIFRYETPKGSLLKKDKPQCMRMLTHMFNDKERIRSEVESIEKVLEETVI